LPIARGQRSSSTLKELCRRGDMGEIPEVIPRDIFIRLADRGLKPISPGSYSVLMVARMMD